MSDFDIDNRLMFNCNAALCRKVIRMSLNRYEQTMFNYWQRQPDELRHWQTKVAAAALIAAAPSGLLNTAVRAYDLALERRRRALRHTPGC